MWKELAEGRDKFIGGVLHDTDPMFGGCSETEITDMSFDGKLFSVTGKDYDCSINREFAGLRAEDGWFVVEAIGVYGCGFRFKRRKSQ